MHYKSSSTDISWCNFFFILTIMLLLTLMAYSSTIAQLGLASLWGS